MRPAPEEILRGLEQCQADYHRGMGMMRVEDVPAGAATEATVARMREAALKCAHHPGMIFLARDILRDVPERDYEGELRAIYEWVVENVRYLEDPLGLEFLQVPCHTAWVQGLGDCDDAAQLVASLAIAAGKGAMFRTVHADERRPHEASHVYPLIGYRAGGATQWFAADTTHHANGGYFGWEPPGVSDGVMPFQDWPVAEP